MHSSSRTPQVCTYVPLSIIRRRHVSWLLPELRPAFTSSLTQVCDLSLWGATSQPALDIKALPSSSHFQNNSSTQKLNGSFEAPAHSDSGPIPPL